MAEPGVDASRRGSGFGEIQTPNSPAKKEGITEHAIRVWKETRYDGLSIANAVLFI